MANLTTFGVYKGEGKEHEEIMYSMALIYSIVSTQVARFLKQFNLTIGKLNILMAIKHHGGETGIRQVKISKHLIVTPSNMTKMLDKLEQDELVVRLSLEGDRRVNIVQITQKGIALLDSIWDGYNDCLKGALNCLEEPKRKELASLLTEWFERIS